MSAASEIQVGSRKTITGEHQIYINAARKPKVSATEAHILKNKPRDHSSQRLKCFENVDMRPQYKEGGNWEALGASQNLNIIIPILPTGKVGGKERRMQHQIGCSDLRLKRQQSCLHRAPAPRRICPRALSCGRADTQVTPPQQSSTQTSAHCSA